MDCGENYMTTSGNGSLSLSSNLGWQDGLVSGSVVDMQEYLQLACFCVC